MQHRSPSGDASGWPYKAGLTFPAPLDALWSYHQRPASDLNVVKAVRAAAVWRENTGIERFLQAARYLGWGFQFPIDLARFLMMRGPEAKTRLGRGYIDQTKDMLKVATRNGLMPRDYYTGDLARHGGGEEMLNSLPYHLYETVARHILPDGAATYFGLPGDKYAFENRCREFGLPVVRTIAIAYPDVVNAFAGEGIVEALPPRDLLIKPVDGRGGQDIERWDFIGRGQFVGADGKPVSGDELMNHFSSSSLSLGSPMLVQLCLENNSELQSFSGLALSKTRIATFLDEQEKPEIVAANFRPSIASNAPIDYSDSRDVSFPLDIETGRLADGYGDARDTPGPIVNHPETGATVSGELLPGWDLMSALALRAHRAFSDIPFIGWDIAYTPDGPIIVEANVPPGTMHEKHAAAGPLVGTRSFTLLAFHAGRWSEAAEPMDSRWRCGGTVP